MNFEFTEAHLHFRAEVRAFLARTLTEEFWQRPAELGGEPQKSNETSSPSAASAYHEAT